MRTRVLAAALLLGSAALASAARADVVATIDGAYDSSCSEDPVCNNAVTSLLYTFSSNTGVAYNASSYDTPVIYIINSSGYDMNVASLTGFRYQGGANGIDLTDTAAGFPATIAANSVYAYIWNTGGGNCGPGLGTNLFANDYDDLLGCSTSDQPGNVQLTFSATLAGGPDAGPIYAQFSPTTNYTGSFVGFEGLDETGNAESVWDAHSGTEVGTLAVIQTGIAPENVPEPITLSLFGAGVAGAAALRRRKSKAA